MPDPSTQPGDGITAEEAGRRIAERRANANLPNPGDDNIIDDASKPPEVASLEAELAPELTVRKPDTSSDIDEDASDSGPEATADDQLDATEDDEVSVDAAEDEASETDDEEEVVEAQEDADETGDEVRFESVEDFASALDVELDEFLDSIKITTKVDGKTEEVPLSVALKGYQLEQTANRRLQQHAEDVKAFAEEQEDVRNRTGQMFQQAGLVFKMAEATLMQEFQGVDWASLERDAPEQYSVLRQKFGERKAGLDQMLQQATAQAKAAVEEQNAAKEKATADNHAKQAELLLEKLPKFGQGPEGKQQVDRIAKVLDSVGYDFKELNAIEDHRLVLLADLATKGQVTTTRQEVLRKKLKTLPPVVRPGTKQRKPLTAQKKAERNAKMSLKKSGSVDDAAAVLLARRR